MIEHDDYYFDPESNEELAARLDDIRGCLIGRGDAAVNPLNPGAISQGTFTMSSEHNFSEIAQVRNGGFL